jgi:hypothetical protein
MYARPGGPSPVTDPDVCASMIAILRTNYANHVGEPDWVELIETLCAANAEFGRLWAEHPIADPGPPLTKSFECFGLGVVRVRATAFPLQRTEARMVVYLPETAADEALIAELRARNDRRRLQPA